MQREEAAIAMERIAREQQPQLREPFAFAQRVVLVASKANTPEERDVEWAGRKQYVLD